MMKYEIFCDGAFSSSRTQMGCGIVILKDNEPIIKWSKMYKGGSNNKAELGAIIIALRMIKQPIESLIFYSDSQYCVGCITQGWKRKKNKIMWEEFDKEYKRVKELCSNIQFIHVYGHQTGKEYTTIWNNEADKLAQAASCQI